MILSSLSLFAAQGCKLTGGSLFGFPHWYEYLDGIKDAQGNCIPHINGINDVWLIVAAVIEIMLRIGAILAVIMVIYAGFTYVTSQGDADKTGAAKKTIVNALVGLAISVLGASIITFIAGSIN
jgi:hypothetical protein